mmetsp:Transcript_90710/g.235248  ORF Transcript_90710/g.235248 Transcript_90710/m.235248 type:complete len:225 (-) Transcript_90710:380-1054(-)
MSVRRTLHRSCTWDNEINLLLSDDCLDSRLPLLGLHRGPWQNVMLGDVGAEARVAESVRQDLCREDLVSIPTHCASDCRGLRHFAAGDEDPELLLWRAPREGSAKDPVPGPGHKCPKQQERRTSPQESDGPHGPQPRGPRAWSLCHSYVRLARLLGAGSRLRRLALPQSSRTFGLWRRKPAHGRRWHSRAPPFAQLSNDDPVLHACFAQGQHRGIYIRLDFLHE